MTDARIGLLCYRCEENVGGLLLRDTAGNILAEHRFCGACLSVERSEFMARMAASQPDRPATVADVAALLGLMDIPTWTQ